MWQPKEKDDPNDPRDARSTPVDYIRCAENGYGFIPLIDEGEPLPTEEHFAVARELEAEHNRQLLRADKEP